MVSVKLSVMTSVNKACICGFREYENKHLKLLSAAGVKHYPQGNLERKEFIWADGSRGLRVHHGREVWWPGQKLWAHTLNLKQEAGKTNSRATHFYALKIRLQGHTVFSKAVP